MSNLNLNIIKDLQPKRIWELFAELSTIPRPSNQEEQVREWIKLFADKNNLEYKQDQIGNLVLYKQAQKSDNPQTLLLQAHMDMVTQKDDDIEFDFTKDAIKLRIDGDFIYATKTTLGSDNGIGLCMILAILEDLEISHPKIQALFTMNEETGMVGISNLDTSLITADFAINLDSEEESVIWTSSAGARDLVLTLKYDMEKIQTDDILLELNISGGRGGHSGVNISENRMNAIKVAGEILSKIQNTIDICISKIDGGTARNAIPRDVSVVFVVKNADLESLDKIQNTIDIYRNYYQKSEPELKISLQPSLSQNQDQAINMANKLDHHTSLQLLNFLNSIHSGVYQMSVEMPNLVQTSANLGMISTAENQIEFHYMIRSNDSFELKKVINILLSQIKLVTDTEFYLDLNNLNPLKLENPKLKIELPTGMEGWKHDPNNPLIPLLEQSHAEIYGYKPAVEAVHAGLECGSIKAYLPNCHVISFGPTIENAHSPQERVEINSVKNCYELLKSVIRKLS